MKRARPEVHESTANIFADLKLPDAESHFLKARIVAEIYRLVTSRKYSQSKVGALMGISQRGKSRACSRETSHEYSVERLINFLTAFDRDVEIVVRPAKSRRRAGRISFTSEAA